MSEDTGAGAYVLGLLWFLAIAASVVQGNLIMAVLDLIPHVGIVHGFILLVGMVL